MKKYEAVEIEVISFTSEDIIITSVDEYDDSLDFGPSI